MMENCGQDKTDGEEREGGGGPFFLAGILASVQSANYVFLRS